MKKNIAVAMGGFSQEFDVSMQSGQVVFDSLSREKFNVFKVLIAKAKWVLLDESGDEFPIDKNDFSFIKNDEKFRFDAVFNAIHGKPGEDGPLAGYFELIGMPQTASGHFQSALTFNKKECSLLLQKWGVTIPKAVYLSENETVDFSKIIEKTGLPVFVKPSRSGSSVGVSKVSDEKDLRNAIEKAREIDTEIIIEKMISGTEVGCGVSNHSGEIGALACTDIVPKNEFFDYDSKYSGESEEITPARIPKDAHQKIMEESEFIYKKLNLNGLARVDYILTNDGTPYFIEVNTIPGLSKASILPKQLAYLRLNLGEIFDLCVEKAVDG